MNGKHVNAPRPQNSNMETSLSSSLSLISPRWIPIPSFLKCMNTSIPTAPYYQGATPSPLLHLPLLHKSLTLFSEKLANHTDFITTVALLQDWEHLPHPHPSSPSHIELAMDWLCPSQLCMRSNLVLPSPLSSQVVTASFLSSLFLH